MFNVKSVNFPSRHPMTEEKKIDSIYNSFNNTKKMKRKNCVSHLLQMFQPIPTIQKMNTVVNKANEWKINSKLQLETLFENKLKKTKQKQLQIVQNHSNGW